MGSDSQKKPFYPHGPFQSTLPHGERQFPHPRQIICGVSIHAPTWGATSSPGGSVADGLVSIHAPTWGATPPSCSHPSLLPQFQSTLPHGERLLAKWGLTRSKVSIHAPTWGATGFRALDVGKTTVSIHAPTWGATNAVVNHDLIEKFQSTLPHGERRSCQKHSLKIWLFQSTLPHGERL